MSFGDVTSANTVGYANQTGIVKDEFYIFGSGFDSVGGGKKINDVIGKVTGVDWDKKGAWKTTATQIQVPSEAGYTTYYYLNDAATGKTTSAPGWADGVGDFVDVDLTPGVAFWFKNKVDADGSVFAQQGQVPDDPGAGIRVECSTEFELHNNPFPMAFKLNGPNVDSSEVVGVNWDKKGAWKTTATQIQVPSEAGYTTYYYLNDAATGKTTSAPGWADGVGDYVDVEIPAGQGFWTKGVSGAFALTFKLNASAAE